MDDLDLSKIVIDRTRVRDVDGFIGTVRYVGPVASAKDASEIYIGIEWDDSSRGKHDGSVLCRTTNRIVRHFHCKKHSSSSSPNAASFLRPKMVDYGVSLTLPLIHTRYVTLDAPLVAVDGILDVAKTTRGRDKNIELVGEIQIRKRQQLTVLKELSLRNMGIATLPSLENSTSLLEELIQSEFAQSVQDVDLAGNLISSWTTVWDIVKIFPMLKHVSLAYNQIMDDDENDDVVWRSQDSIVKSTFPNLTRWNLNECGITSFHTILSVECKCPNLQELYLAQNHVVDITSCCTVATRSTTSTLPPSSEEDDDVDHPRQASVQDPVLPLHVFQHLTKLDLTYCKLHSWTLQVRMLRKLPQLQVLILNDNPLRQITCLPSSNNMDHIQQNDEIEFASLQELHLGGTLLDSWMSIHPLNFFPQLSYLRLSSTPLTEALGIAEARVQIIARLSHIQQVNASPVTPKERIEAERRYVRGVAHELLKLQGLEREEEEIKKKHVLAQHPLFESLFVKHKDSMMTSTSSFGERGGGGSTAQASHYNTLQVTIRSMASSSITAEPIQKRLPTSFPIGRLKTLCFKSFGLDVHLQRLHVRCEGDAFPTELDDDEHTLEYYGVSDGAEILMNEIDVEAREREQLQERQMHEQRIAQQERSISALQARKNKE